MKPNFLVIGCGKCGTTTLCAMLARHPQVFVATPKEPNFLAHDDVYARGWSWYESLFDSGRDAVARGEGSVSYTMAEHEDRVIERLLQHMPDVRLIYIVRHPLRRLESVFREHHDTGHRRGWYLPFDIGEAIDYRPAMLQNTLYWERINAYRRRLPDDRLLVLFLEDLRADPQRVLSRCCSFLGVDATMEMPIGDMHLNRGSGKYYDTRLMRAVRLTPVLGPLWHGLPRRLRLTLERPLRRRFADGVDWPPDVRSAVLRAIEPDAARFLRHYGKPSGFWNLGVPSTEVAEAGCQDRRASNMGKQGVAPSMSRPDPRRGGNP